MVGFEQLKESIEQAGDLSALSRANFKEIQTQLAESGLYVDKQAYIDGISGPMTDHALALLDEDYARSYLADMAVTDNDLSKTDLMMMQAALNRLGGTENPLELDGKFGPKTANALQAFLSSHEENIAVNIAPSLKNKLFKYLDDEDKALFAPLADVPLPRPRPTDLDTAAKGVPLPRPRPEPEPEPTAIVAESERVLLPPLAPPRDIEEILAEQAAKRMENLAWPTPLDQRPQSVPPLTTSLDATMREVMLHPDLIDRMNADIKVMENVALTYKYADIYGVNPQILANQFWQESRFNPNAVSPADAKGISQMTLKTGNHYDLHGSDFFNAEKSIEAGARYMADLEAEYGPQLALVAYNGGPDAIKFVQEHAGQEIGMNDWMEFMTDRAIAKDNKAEHPGAWHNETREYAAHILTPYWSEEMIDRAWAKPENQMIALTGNLTAVDAINAAFPMRGADNIVDSAMAYAPSVQNLMKSEINVTIDNMLGIHFGNAASGHVVALAPLNTNIVQQSHDIVKGPTKGAFGMDLMMP